MDETARAQDGRTFKGALRWFDIALQFMAGVTLALLIALPVLAILTTPTQVGVKIEPVYSLCWGEGRPVQPGEPSTGGPCPVAPGTGQSLTVYSDGNSSSTGNGRNAKTYLPTPSIHANLDVARDDTDTRVAAAVMDEAVLALAALVLLSLHLVVSSARAGEPFAARNVNRLRCAAAGVAGAFIVLRVGAVVLNHTLDRSRDLPNVHVTPEGLGWWATIVITLGLLALAQVFRVGSDLREFEQAAI